MPFYTREEWADILDQTLDLLNECQPEGAAEFIEQLQTQRDAESPFWFSKPRLREVRNALLAICPEPEMPETEIAVGEGVQFWQQAWIDEIQEKLDQGCCCAFCVPYSVVRFLEDQTLHSSYIENLLQDLFPDNPATDFHGWYFIGNIFPDDNPPSAPFLGGLAGGCPDSQFGTVAKCGLESFFPGPGNVLWPFSELFHCDGSSFYGSITKEGVITPASLGAEDCLLEMEDFSPVLVAWCDDNVPTEKTVTDPETMEESQVPMDDEERFLYAYDALRAKVLTGGECPPEEDE